MAQQQETQALVRVADAVMSGQPAPSDFPVQFQSDFLKAQGGRAWVPIILTLDPAKVPSGAVTLYLRVTPKGMAAPPPPSAPPVPDKNEKNEKNDKNNKDKKKDAKAPAPPAPAANYPYEDVSFLDLKPVYPGSHCAFSAASGSRRAATICISSCTSARPTRRPSPPPGPRRPPL